MSLIEVTQDDYGSTVSVTLHQTDDDTTAEDLTNATSITLDITRGDGVDLVSDGAVSIYDTTNGIIYFTPTSTWFTETALDGMSHYMAVFKIIYASGQKKTLGVPLYVNLL